MNYSLFLASSSVVYRHFLNVKLDIYSPHTGVSRRRGFRQVFYRIYRAVGDLISGIQENLTVLCVTLIYFFTSKID